MIVKILISGTDSSLFNTVNYDNGTNECITTTEDLCEFEGFRTVFVTKREFYTEIMDITPTDIEVLPDINLFHSLGIQGDLVKKCRLIKPHVLIYSKGNRLERLLEADIKVELFQLSQSIENKHKNIVIKYSTYFNGEIEIVPSMFEDDNFVNRFNSDVLRTMRLGQKCTPGKIMGIYGRMLDTYANKEWILSTYERDFDLMSEVMGLISKRIISNLLLDKILAIAANPTLAIIPDNKPNLSARIDAIITELLELKKELN